MMQQILDALASSPVVYLLVHEGINAVHLTLKRQSCSKIVCYMNNDSKDTVPTHSLTCH